MADLQNLNNYNYYDEVLKDMLAAFKSNLSSYASSITDGNWSDVDALSEEVETDFWADDAVTGNATKDGYDLTEEEKCYIVTHNIPLIKEVISEFDISSENLYNWDYMDTSARCYVMVSLVYSREFLDQVKDILIKWFDNNKQELTEEEIENFNDFIDTF